MRATLFLISDFCFPFSDFRIPLPPYPRAILPSDRMAAFLERGVLACGLDRLRMRRFPLHRNSRKNPMTDILQEIEQGAEALLTDIENLFEAEVVALAPVAQNAIATLATQELVDLTTPGGTKNTGKTLATVVSSTVSAAEAAGIQAGATSILTAINKAIPAPSTRS